MKLLVCVSVAVLASLGFAGGASAAPSPQSTAAKSPFEREIASAKGAMLGEPQAAFGHAKSAEALASAMPQGREKDLLLAMARWLEGEASTRLRKPNEAQGYLGPALSTAHRLAPNTKLQGDIMRSLGRANAALGDVHAALGDYQDAYRIYQQANEPRGQAMALQDIGSVYMTARDYRHVLQYYAQSSEIYHADPALILTAHNNRGIALKELRQPADALKEFQLAFSAAQETGSTYLQAHILTDIALSEVALKRLARAETDVKRGLALGARDQEAGAERPFLLGVLAKIRAAQGDGEAAAGLLDQTFAGVAINSTPMDFRDLHETAWRVYDEAGRPALALKHMEAFKRLDDQGRELAASTNAALMAAQFDFTNQSLKIAKLKAGQLEAEARMRNVVITGLIAAGGATLAVTLLGFFGMRRSRNRIRAAHAELGVVNKELEVALKAKTEFLATTSHEIRTPLNGILGMTQVMLAEPGSPSDTRERLKLVRAAGETMKALVDDLLDVAKVETGSMSLSPQPYDLRRAVSETLAFWSGQAEAKGLHLELRCETLPPRILGDESRLRQVLYNLMSNALKFTETGAVTLAARTEGEELVLSIEDTGIGIPAHEQRRIFEAFTQVDGGTDRKYGGTGLGLCICEKVVTAMGGTITVKSREGEGSTFTIRTPLVEVAQPASAAIGARSLASARVLVIDPNPLARSIIDTMLAPVSAGVATASDLDEAQDLLATQPIDLILTDGTLVLERGALRVSPAHVQWVATLPQAMASEAPALSSLGASAVLLRPLTASELVQRLEAVMAGAAAVEMPIAA